GWVRHGLPDQRTKAVLAESLCELSAPIAIVKLRSCDQRYRENVKRTLLVKVYEEKRMENENHLMAIVESMIELLVEVMKSLKKQKIKKKCYRPRLCYVCRRQEHLARSCLNQVKHECQEHIRDVQFMRIIDPKVGKYENGKRVGNDKRERINDGRFKKKATRMKNITIPVKSFCKKGEDFVDDVESNEFSKAKSCEVGAKKNKFKPFTYHQRSVRLSDTDRDYKVNHRDKSRKTNMSINISSDEMRQMNNKRFECLPESNCEVTLDIKSAEEMARKNECDEVDVINGDGNHGNTETRMRNGMISMTNI
ncbi:32342_t:CDS:2, partial [Gigaspora margarita]